MLKKRKLIAILILTILIAMLFNLVVNANETHEIIKVDEAEILPVELGETPSEEDSIIEEAEILPLDVEETSTNDDIVEEENPDFILDESDDQRIDAEIEEQEENEIINTKEPIANSNIKLKMVLVIILFIIALGVLIYRKHDDLSSILLNK